MRYLVFILPIFFSLKVTAQVEHLARYEVDKNNENKEHFIIPNDENGLLLVMSKFKVSSQKYPIELHYLDHDLKLKWETKIEVEQRYNFIGYHYVEGKSYLLFQNRSSNKIIRIIRIDAINQKIDELETKEIVDFEVSEFEIIKNSAILGGYIEDRPVVFAYDMDTEVVRTLPNVYQKNSELIEVRVNSDQVTFNVLVAQKTELKDRTILVNTYDYLGNAIRDYTLQTPPNYQLLSGVSSSIVNKEQIVVGMFSIKAGTYPAGMYVNHVNRTGQQTMKYYNFGEFESFFDHLGKKGAKTKERALAAKAKKKDWRYKTDAIFKELIEIDGKRYLAGEFYQPWSVSTFDYQRVRNQARFANRMFGPSINSMPYYVDPSRLAGQGDDINYTHAFMIELDVEGNPVWDGAYELEDDNLVGSLDFVGDFQVHNDQAYYAYYNEDQLHVDHLNSIKDSTSRSTDLVLMNENDKLRLDRNEYSHVISWFGNRFLVSGIQHVKGDKLRKVLYINAVSVGPDLKQDVEE